MIELAQINKVYETKQGTIKAVDNVDLTIDNGDIFGIIGYSGAGKSTLVRMLNGLEKPTSGNIVIGGSDIASLKGKALRNKRQKIGMIFQHFNLLWSRTVLDNVLLPLEIAGVSKSKQAEKAAELIRLVGLEGRESSYPAQLSGGQKQRVGIARSLANDPDLLLCDEATSALDPQTTDEVLDLLVDINKKLGLTIIIITHEMHVIRKICSHVAVMESGKVVEKGEVLEVFKRPKQEITKRFIRQDVNPDSEDTDAALSQLLEDHPEGRFIHLLFHGEQTNQPILSKIIRQYKVELNIIQGSIQQAKEESIGSLYVQVTGEETEIEQAIEKIRTMDVEVEVLSDVSL